MPESAKAKRKRPSDRTSDNELERLKLLCKSYSRSYLELEKENKSYTRTLDKYYTFYLRLRTKLYSLQGTSPKIKKLFKEIVSFMKEYN